VKFWLLIVLVLPFSALATEAPTPPIPGAFTVQSAEYKFDATIDADVLKSAATELWARAFWPTDLSKPRPIVFLLHGNHSTCRDGKDDYDCSYTNEGTCPTGQTVIANHEGYNYLAQQLASLGYIAVTINANRGITCGNGNDADWGLNLARGRLVLRHIELWNKWATQGGAPPALGSPDLFLGKVDVTQVGLMGHSRGGEGMRAAAAQYRDAGSVWPARIPNLQIRGIFEIGSVDGQAGRVLDADDMAWNQILPMCDGDVSDLQGRLPFERMLRKLTETRKTPKSLEMVYGTNHNFYNTEWQTDESLGCLGHKEVHGPGPQSDNQQKIAMLSLSSFMLANVGTERNTSMGQMFDPSYSVPQALTAITRVDRDNVYTIDRTYDVVVDDFDNASGVSSSRKPNLANGVTVKNESTELPSRTTVEWTAPGADHFMQLNWADEGQGRDVSAFTSLDLRVGRPIDQMTEKSTEFSIALVDAKGVLSTPVPVTKYADIFGPGNNVDLYQTVRIPIADFALPAGFSVRGVRVIFDRTEKGSLHFANVRFAANDTAAFFASLNLPLAPEEIVLPPAKASVSEDERNNTEVQGNNNTAAPTNPLPPTPPNVTPLFPLTPKAILKTANVMGAKTIAASKYLSGRPAVEIAVTATSGVFMPEAQLPTLVVAGNKFSVSRYPPTGRLNALIFSVPQSDFDRLPAKGPMWVQYGRTNARKIWRLPSFSKSELQH
jgi:hypothetical protein